MGIMDDTRSQEVYWTKWQSKLHNLRRALPNQGIPLTQSVLPDRRSGDHRGRGRRVGDGPVHRRVDHDERRQAALHGPSGRRRDVQSPLVELKQVVLTPEQFNSTYKQLGLGARPGNPYFDQEWQKGNLDPGFMAYRRAVNAAADTYAGSQRLGGVGSPWLDMEADAAYHIKEGNNEPALDWVGQDPVWDRTDIREVVAAYRNGCKSHRRVYPTGMAFPMSEIRPLREVPQQIPRAEAATSTGCPAYSYNPRQNKFRFDKYALPPLESMSNPTTRAGEMELGAEQADSDRRPRWTRSPSQNEAGAHYINYMGRRMRVQARKGSIVESYYQQYPEQKRISREKWKTANADARNQLAYDRSGRVASAPPEDPFFYGAPPSPDEMGDVPPVPEEASVPPPEETPPAAQATNQRKYSWKEELIDRMGVKNIKARAEKAWGALESEFPEYISDHLGRGEENAAAYKDWLGTMRHVKRRTASPDLWETVQAERAVHEGYRDIESWQICPGIEPATVCTPRWSENMAGRDQDVSASETRQDGR